MLTQEFFRVKGQALIAKCYFLWVGTINMQSLSRHYLMRQQVPMVFLRLLVYLGAVAYISIEISLGFMLAQGYFKGQRSRIDHKLKLFMTLCDMQSSSGNYSMHHQVHMVSSFSLSKCCLNLFLTFL